MKTNKTKIIKGIIGILFYIVSLVLLAKVNGMLPIAIILFGASMNIENSFKK